MTKRELNRDVKKLYDEYVHFSFQSNYTFAKWATEEAEKELIRLYNADSSLESLSAENLRKMIKINLRIQAIPCNQFGMQIKF